MLNTTVNGNGNSPPCPLMSAWNGSYSRQVSSWTAISRVMTIMNKRISYHLTELKNELRKRAMKEKDEEKRTDYWRLYYKVLHAEHEVREMVMDAEIRR